MYLGVYVYMPYMYNTLVALLFAEDEEGLIFGFFARCGVGGLTIYIILSYCNDYPTPVILETWFIYTFFHRIPTLDHYNPRFNRSRRAVRVAHFFGSWRMWNIFRILLHEHD